MNIENSDKHGARGKTLAELWLMRYLVESKLDIKNPKDIDPFAFVLWLQTRPEPSLGQKRNIAAAIRKHVGLKLPPIFGKPREVLEVIKPSLETYKSTLDALCSFRDNAPIELKKIRYLACIAFICASMTGLSIPEVMRSEISNKQENNPEKCDAGKEKNKITISVSSSGSLNAYNSRAKKTYLACSARDIEHCEEYFKMLKEAGSSIEHKQIISQIQYIITKHNAAKGYSLRQLRSLYPEILGYLKSTG